MSSTDVVRRATEASWQRSIETSLGVSSDTYLRRRKDVQREVFTTSYCQMGSVLEILGVDRGIEDV